LQFVSASIPSLTADRRRWATLIVVCFAQLMIVLDVTIVNVALPAIQRDLDFSQANLTWVVNAFLAGAVTIAAGIVLAFGLLRPRTPRPQLQLAETPAGTTTVPIPLEKEAA